MSEKYNLYKSLNLDNSASTEELGNKLNGRLSELRAAGATEQSGQYQEAFTALQILGDQQRRKEYDAMLADDDSTITISTLRELASRQMTAQTGTAESGATGTNAAPSDTAPGTTPAPASSRPSNSALTPNQFSQPQWSAPAQIGPATVTTTVTTQVPPLPSNATVSMMWKRMPKVPRIVTSFIGSATVLGIVLVLFTVLMAFRAVGEFDTFKDDSSLGELFSYSYSAFEAGLALFFLSLILLFGVVLTALSAYWVHEIMKGGSETTPTFFTITVAPLALAMVVLSIVFFIDWEMIFVLLVGVALIAACILVLLKDMRAWFRGQALIRTAQPAPGAQFAPQNGQGNGFQSFNYSQNQAFGQPNQFSQPTAFNPNNTFGRPNPNQGE